MRFVPLSVHSQYSILNSTASIPQLVEKARSYEIDSLAITDAHNMHGVVDFYKECLGAGIKPLIGAELRVAPTLCTEKKKIPGKRVSYPIVLIAINKEGYRNLCKLSSAAYLEGFYYTPRIDKQLLENHSNGLICLSGPLEGPLASAFLEGGIDAAVEEMHWYRHLFGDRFYMQIERLSMSEEAIRQDGFEAESWLYTRYQNHLRDETAANAALITLAKEEKISLVATNSISYIEREDWVAHEILINIQSGEPREIWQRDSFGNPKGKMLNPKREVLIPHEHHFKAPSEIQERFADVPEAVISTGEIADRSEFKLDLKTKFYPVYIPPHLEGKEISAQERDLAAKQFLSELCYEAIEKRYPSAALSKVEEKYPGEDPLKVVKERLSYELALVTRMGMSDYLLIVYDFIDWAKRQNIPVGPGRGSGAGSIILYLIGITDIEPLRFNLFFERFINPERISYPDIDVDICMERRAEVIAYTLKKYGSDRVAQIITFGTMKAKMAIKDVGRVLNVPLAKVNDLAKLIPEDPNMTLDKALEIDPTLGQWGERDPEIKQIIEIAKKLEGSIRNTGIHAAGMIISGEPLTEHIPVCNAKDSEMLVTQYAMKPVESVGMLKIDFLGLKTLTCIQKTVQAIEKTTGVAIDWINLPLDDQTTFDLLNQGKTSGVFQLESSGMQELARSLHIDRFEEIIAVGALYRPGPMEMIPSFISRKHGREAIESEHPLIQDILAETYGIMVYQEQVMQIASRLAKYSLGEGDVLRKAMGKKDHTEMARQREKFRAGAMENGVSETLAIEIFEKIEKFASYGFNKSHATAYGYLSYVTAYLKANYPKQWLSALMTCDQDDISKVAKHIRQAQGMEIPILPPDVNESDREFAATREGIRFGLAAIKGIGQGVVEAIVQERKQKGPFTSLSDFCLRIDPKKTGKKAAESLIEAGAFDFTGWNRQQMTQVLSPMWDSAARQHQEQERGILDLFSQNTILSDPFAIPPVIETPTPIEVTLSKEKELLGFYLTGHPMNSHREKLQELECLSLDQLNTLPSGKPAKIAFIVDEIKTRISKAQKKFAILLISDGYEQFEMPVFPDLYERSSSLLKENQLLFGVVIVEKEEEVIRLRPRFLSALSDLSDEVIDLAEALFKQASTQQKKERPVTVETAQAQKEQQCRLLLELDMKEMRLSDILTLKEIFQTYAGQTGVEISFHRKGGGKDLLAIGNEWGVRFSPELETSLRRLSFFKGMKLESLDLQPG